MPDDSQPDPVAVIMGPLEGDPAGIVRTAIEVVSNALAGYGIEMPNQLSAAQAGDALEAASALLGTIAAQLHRRADEDEAAADDEAPELLSPAIRQAFAKGCAPASPDGLEKAICVYRGAHIVIAGLASPQLVWNDAEAGAPPSPAKVRDDISQVIKAARAFRAALANVSGEALGRVSIPPFEADGTMGFAEAVFRQSGELIGHAETALDELGESATPGRTVSPKTRLALQLGDFLATSGVPVVVGGKPSTQWALAYDLALEASGDGPCLHARKTLQRRHGSDDRRGDGPCLHARKTLQNAIAMRQKERMPPAA